MEKQELTETILSTRLNSIPLPNNTYLISKTPANEGIYLL
jgi:hypothetical protein